MLLLRSLLFQFYFFASVAVAALLVVLASVVSGKLAYTVTRRWAQSMMWAGKLLCGLDYVIEGVEHLPDAPSIALIKHSSVFEAYAQITILPTQAWVLKRELFWIPIFGWGLARLRPIAINRKAGRSAVKQVIQQGKERLRDGVWVTVFPEGTRVAPGESKKYGVSGAALARETGAVIVPIAHNAGDFWPRRSVLKKPGLIRVCIGPPIDASGRPPKETNRIVQEWIEAKMAEISVNYPAAPSAGESADGSDEPAQNEAPVAATNSSSGQ